MRGRGVERSSEHDRVRGQRVRRTESAADRERGGHRVRRTQSAADTECGGHRVRGSVRVRRTQSVATQSEREK